MIRRALVLSLIAAATLTRPSALAADGTPIDTTQSKLTIFVYKSGLFSAFADNHIIDAAIASGSISDESPQVVSIEVRTANIVVRDPDLSASKRSEVQMRMLGPDVLDTDKFPTITFESTAVEHDGPDKWKVSGRLTIHGQTRPVTFATTKSGGRYRGTVAIKQRDFEIMPISIAGGAVKVKDELKIEFDVVAQSR